jgi:hypothetical protein
MTTEEFEEKLKALVKEYAESKDNGLLKNRTAYIEGLQDSFNQQAEGEWENIAIFAEARKDSQRRCYVEGMKAGAEWICKAVGVKAEFVIDDRFKEGEDE